MSFSFFHHGNIQESHFAGKVFSDSCVLGSLGSYLHHSDFSFMMIKFLDSHTYDIFGLCLCCNRLIRFSDSHVSRTFNIVPPP